MSTNWGDRFVIAMRARLVTASGLPTIRCWANTSQMPPADQASVDDAVVSMDTKPMEVGPDAWKRTDAVYRVVVSVPINSDIHRLQALAAAIEAAFWPIGIEVDGNPVEVHRVHWTKHEGDALYSMMVYIVAQFDHP